MDSKQQVALTLYITKTNKQTYDLFSVFGVVCNSGIYCLDK